MVGIILAAGESKRMGKNKLLLDFRGKPLIQWAIESVKKSNLKDVIVVYKDNEVKIIAEELKVRSIENKDYKNGQSESVKVGVKNISVEEDIMFIVGDIPLINVGIINGIIANFNEKGGIVACRNCGNVKNPIAFSKEFRTDLLDLKGDVGGKDVIMNNLQKLSFYDVNEGERLNDIDTVDEYERLIKNISLRLTGGRVWRIR